MNILFYYPSGFDVRYGGTEKVMERLSDRFVADGHSVFYVSIHKPTDYESPYPHLILDRAKRGYLTSVRIKELENYVRDKKIDIIIDNYHHNRTKYIKIVSEVKKRTGVKVVNLYHTTPAAHEQQYRAYNTPDLMNLQVGKISKRRMYYKLGVAHFHQYATKKSLLYRLHKYDRIVFLSKEYIQYAMRLTGKIYSEKYAAIPNAVGSLSTIPYPQQKKNQLLWVGRMDYLKRPDLALKAWSMIEAKYPDWQLVFVGDGEFFNIIKQRSKVLDDRCIFAGYCIPESYYATSKIFLMTSDIEGFGLVIVEAQRHGTVPVAYNTYDAVNDIIANGENGYVVAKGDVTGYAEQVSKLMDDEDLLKRMSSNAREGSKEYCIENIMPLWYDLFRQIGLKVNDRSRVPNDIRI